MIIFDSIKNLNETLGRKKYKKEKQSWKKENKDYETKDLLQRKKEERKEQKG